MLYYEIYRNDGKLWRTKDKIELLSGLGLLKRERSMRDWDEEGFGKKTTLNGFEYQMRKFIVPDDTEIEIVENVEDEVLGVVGVEKRKYVPKVYKNDNNVRLTILSGDKHFKYEHKDAIDILEQVCEDYSEFIDEFIDGGDGIDNTAMSKHLNTEEEQFTLYDEMLAFEEHLYKMKEILPNAKFTLVHDNHFHLRLKRFLAENPAMKGLIRKIEFPFDEEVKHGIPYFPFEQKRVGVIHGIRATDNFTKAHSQLFNEDMINFHTHTSQHYTCKNGSKTLNKQPQKMWGVPSMCKEMEYMNGSPSRSNTGFAMLWYDLENDTYQLNYVFVENKTAIVNGKVYKSRV